MSHEPYLDPGRKRLLRRFWRNASGFWRGKRAWRAWLLAALLIATVLLQLAVQYSLKWITDSHIRLAEWAASADRVASLLLALDDIDHRERPDGDAPVAGGAG